MNYPETLDYIYQKLPMFSRMGSDAFKKDLTNIRLLCQHLGNPQQTFKTIHIAGTNGKGSVSHMLAAIFQKAGYKTGLYTSPHLYDFRERIKFNGHMIPQEFVIGFIEKIKPLIEEILPSFFEITVAMAFEYFAEQEADVALIEVGLGGRLDSTNIITPELSVITNIGWDHMNMLGNSLEEIAAEKAGIIKENVPVVIGEVLPETSPVFHRIAKEKKAPVYLAEEYFEEVSHQLNSSRLNVEFKQVDGTAVRLETDLPGIYQVNNIRTVLMAVALLKKLNWKLDDKTVVMPALQEVKKITGLGGRWEIIHEKPTVVLEVAHNKNGIEKMLQHIQQIAFHQLHIVFGTVRDKEANQVLELLPPSASYYFTQAHIPRALPSIELQKKAQAFHLAGEVYADVNLALKAAKANANQDDLIIVCGSIFLVAEVDKTQ